MRREKDWGRRPGIIFSGKRLRFLLTVLVISALTAVPAPGAAAEEGSPIRYLEPEEGEAAPDVFRGITDLAAGDVSQYVEGVLSIFGITEKSLKNAEISKIKDRTYTGSAICPVPVITYMGYRLKKGTDYTITWSDNVRVGTARCRITGKGDFTGTRTVSFKILRKNSSSSSSGTSSSSKKFTVSITKNQLAYTGKLQKPSVRVTSGGKTVASKYYTVTYKNNRNVGTGTVTVTGKNTWKGYKGTADFRILPGTPSVTSVKNASEGKFQMKWKKRKESEGYQVQYCTRKAFDKNTHRKEFDDEDTTTCTVDTGLSNKTIYVRIRSYRTVKGSRWFSEWSSPRKVKIR